MKDWYDEDDFWDIIAPVIFDEEEWENALKEVNNIIELTKVKPNSCVADICCGSGRHSIAMSRSGFRVLGVDRTLKYVEEARNRAEREKLDAKFVQEDMREFCRPETFDLIINLGTSFGYFEDPKDDLIVLSNAHRSLKPGGIFIMDTMGKEVLARTFYERDWFERDDMLFLEERFPIKDWTWVENHWIIIKNDKRRDVVFKYRLFTAADLKSMLHEAGFETVKIFGSLTGSPYDHLAKRLVAMGIKGKNSA
jgi:SAM-dependent methyltransferase